MIEIFANFLVLVWFLGVVLYVYRVTVNTNSHSFSQQLFSCCASVFWPIILFVYILNYKNVKNINNNK